MGFAGKFSTLSFADLIQLLASTRKTGTLHVGEGSQWKKIYLRDGLVVALSSNDPDEYVSYALVALGKVSEADMARAVLRQPQEGKLIGKILVDEGSLSEEVLQRYLADKAYEMVAKLMAWTEAEFRFEEFALPAQEFCSLNMSAEQLLMEGFRRSDEMSRFRQFIPTDDVVLELTGDESADVGSKTVVMRMLRELEVPRSVRELKRTIKASDYSLLEGLTEMLEAGVLKVGERRPVTTAPPAGWLIEARKMLISGFTDKAIETLRNGLTFDAGNIEGRGLLMQAENRFVREVTRKEIPFDAIPEQVVSLESLADSSLSPAEAFVLSRATGDLDVSALLESIPLPMAELLLILKRLLRDDFLRLRLK